MNNRGTKSQSKGKETDCDSGRSRFYKSGPRIRWYFPCCRLVHCSRRSQKAEVPRIIVDPSPVTGSPRHQHVKPTTLSRLTRHASTFGAPIGSFPDFVDGFGISLLGDLNVIVSNLHPTELLGPLDLWGPRMVSY